jgi:hypothetical protein
MARYEGLASIRRALSMPNGSALLDIKPVGLNWQWAQVPSDRAREALACALAAMDGRWKMYVSLPDDPDSNVLEIVGVSNTPEQPEPLVLYRGGGIAGYDLAAEADRMVAFDYNSSGRLDHLVLYRPGTGTIWILRNNGGAFTPVYQRGDPGDGIGGFNLANPVDRVLAFDYNSSGKLDHLVLYRPGTGTIWILRNDAGTFTPVYQRGEPGDGIGGYDLASPADRVFAFDFNSSGKLDHLALYRPGTGTIWILRNNAGTFTPVFAQGAPGNGVGGYNLASAADRVFAFDYNSSGRLDHLVLYRRAGTGTIWILRNDAGTFTPVYQQGEPGSGIGGYDLASPNDRVFAFDYSNVGKLDHLVLYRPGEGNIWILSNSGGVFTAVFNSDSGIRGYALTDLRDRALAFDYNGNGRRDNLVLYRPGAGVIWILNSLNN